MEQPIYDYVLMRLQQRKGEWPKVAERAGMSKRTLEKIARREIADPGVSHIQRLADFFRAEEREAA